MPLALFTRASDKYFIFSKFVRWRCCITMQTRSFALPPAPELEKQESFHWGKYDTHIIIVYKKVSFLHVVLEIKINCPPPPRY